MTAWIGEFVSLRLATKDGVGLFGPQRIGAVLSKSSCREPRNPFLVSNSTSRRGTTASVSCSVTLLGIGLFLFER